MGNARRTRATRDQERIRRRNRRMVIAAGAAIAIVILLIVVQQTTSNGPAAPDPTSLTGLPEVNAEFSGLPEKAGVIGRAGATVTIVEYGDLRCPVCRAFDSEVVPTLVQNLVRSGKAKLQFRTWAILGPNSVAAAQAAYAASRQNALWRYAALTYFNQGDETVDWFTPAFARSVAEAIGLDLERFDRDRTSTAAVAAVAAVNNEAIASGFQGTPTIRIVSPNGAEVVESTYEAIAAGVAKASGGAE